MLNCFLQVTFRGSRHYPHYDGDLDDDEADDDDDDDDDDEDDDDDDDDDDGRA